MKNAIRFIKDTPPVMIRSFYQLSFNSCYYFHRHVKQTCEDHAGSASAKRKAHSFKDAASNHHRLFSNDRVPVSDSTIPCLNNKGFCIITECSGNAPNTSAVYVFKAHTSNSVAPSSWMANVKFRYTSSDWNALRSLSHVWLLSILFVS